MADAPVPGGIEPGTVGYAKELARDALGTVGFVVAIRFVGARCALDAANPSVMGGFSEEAFAAVFSGTTWTACA